MNKITDFTVYCLENYKQKHHMTGKDVLEIFEKNDVFGYIREYYDVLHTTGEDYIVRDLEKYIKIRANKC